VNGDGTWQCEAFGGTQMVQTSKLTQTAMAQRKFLDVDTCAAQGPANSRFALVASYTGDFPDDMLPHVLKLRNYGGWADVVILTTPEDAVKLSNEQLTALSVNKVRLVRTDQILDPELLQRLTHSSKCDLQDLVGLHALALEGYDGVALYSRDAEPHGDLRPILTCAAAGHVMTASNGIDETSTGIDFVAARPDRHLLNAVLSLGRRTSSGEGCAKDLLETLLHRDNNPALSLAFAQSGLKHHAGAEMAVEIDPCIWNYRAGQYCGDNFDTSRIRVQRGHANEGQGALQFRSPMSLIAREPSFGFWFPVFNVVSPVLSVVAAVRKFYPESPILLLSDGGMVDFSKVCQRPKYNCKFEMATPQNSRWNPHSWFRRMRDGVQTLGTDYVIYLEPDVQVRHRHTIHPEHDAGGVFDNYNPSFGANTVHYLEKMGRKRNPDFKILWTHFGLTGGSYFRSEAILDAFAPEHIKKLDYVGLQKDMGEPSWSSDLAMHLALSARGWVVYPWKDCGQNFQNLPFAAGDLDAQRQFAKKWPAFLPTAAFEHDHKEHYSDPLDKEDDGLPFLLEDHPPDVVCHGCVWWDFDDHLLSIPSEAPLPQEEEDRFAHIE